MNTSPATGSLALLTVVGPTAIIAPAFGAMRSRLGSYALTVALCLVLLVAVLELWRVDPRVPLHYFELDSALISMLVKSIGETGWVMHNPRLGAPFGQAYYDYPFIDAFHFLALRALSTLVGDWGALTNLYYFLSFPLVGVASLFALRSLGVSAASAVAVSVLFAFLPYHLHPARGIQHLFLSSYFAIPLVTLLVLRIASGRPVSGGARSRSAGAAVTIAIALLAASTGVYYAFFACFLLFIAGVLAWSRGHRRSAAGALGLIVLICAAVAAQIVPAALYRSVHGNNPGVASRHPGESELFGLKIAQLLLPVDGHRVPTLARLKAGYNRSTALNENSSATLGIVGAFGFLFLLARLLFFRVRHGGERSDGELLDSLAVFNLAALLLGTIGGFGAFFAVLVSPQLRAWSRMCIYIASFSLFSVALLLDRVCARGSSGGEVAAPAPALASSGPAGARPAPGGKGGRKSSALLVLLLLVGVADETSRGFVPAYGEDRRAYRDDADFVHAIETALPAGAMVFQLPYVPFPENPPVRDMHDYEHLRGYLHSRALRWSYGTIKGRGADAWQREVAGKPTAELLRTLALAGFAGVYVDRRGYEDRAAALEGELGAKGGGPALVSRDGNLSFFDLTSFAHSLRAELSPAAWKDASEEALRQPLSFHWQGCAGREVGAESDWRWCGATATLTILNPGPGARRVKLEMLLATGRAHPSAFYVEGADLAEPLTVNDAETHFAASLTVPFPALVLCFRCEAEPIVVPDDQRELVFRMTNFRAGEIR